MSLLPNQSYIAPNKSLWAPAGSGGGGGGGSNFNGINVSSINFTSNPGYITYTGAIALDGLNTGAQDFTFAAPSTIIPVYPAGLNSTTGCLFRMTAPASQAYLQTAVATDEAIFIDAVGAGGAAGIYINAGGVATSAIGCSTLTVSSINGLQPGGGGSVPMNLGISTLTLNNQPTALGGTLGITATDANLYNFAVKDSNAAAVADFSVGYVGGRNQFFASVGEIDNFQTSTIKAVAGVSAIPILTPISVSSISVSSINGAIPGVAANGGAIGVQSIPDTGPIALVCDLPGGSGNATPLNTPLSISTTLAHTYTYTAEASIQAGGNQTAESQIQLQFGNNTRFYDQVRFVSTIVGPNKVVSLNWRFIATGTGGNSVYGYAWDNAGSNASTTVILSKQSLTDYGVIL